ncbi:LacI family DNA-binding transcriptional regulator [Spirillospora sp. CA-128828]|uniref:LacI family DNA-binding transcriptional regulator n=1 Tax=Spirillospora sp. CA-128828 TaxID=3240033 RepID=UPI003D933CF9
MRKDEPVTLLAVARAAGVSKTTASDALRGSGRVSAETRAMVTRVADTLGYVPNGTARHLRRASTGTIGLHVPDVLTRSTYYMPFVFGVVENAAARDYDITLITSGSPSRVPRVDGLILGDPLAGDAVVEKLMTSGLPTVTCEHFPGDAAADGVVWSRHSDKLTEMLGHLRASGAAHPALVAAGSESEWAASLQRGYREWCVDVGIPPAVRTVPFEAAAEDVHAAVEDLLAAEPHLDALVCAPAGAAARLQPALRRTGSPFLLASCVDSPAMSLADPPITAIDLRPREAGATCADLLFDLLDGRAAPGTERIHPIELNLRASTRPARAGG